MTRNDENNVKMPLSMCYKLTMRLERRGRVKEKKRMHIRSDTEEQRHKGSPWSLPLKIPQFAQL